MQWRQTTGLIRASTVYGQSVAPQTVILLKLPLFYSLSRSLSLMLCHHMRHFTNRGCVFVQTEACECVQRCVRGSVWPAETQPLLDPLMPFPGLCATSRKSQAKHNCTLCKQRRPKKLECPSNFLFTISIMFSKDKQLSEGERESERGRRRERGGANQILSCKGCRSKWSMSLLSVFLWSLPSGKSEQGKKDTHTRIHTDTKSLSSTFPYTVCSCGVCQNEEATF